MNAVIDPLIPPRARAAFPPPTVPKARPRKKPARKSRVTALGLSALTTVGLAAQFAHDQRTADSAGASAAGAGTAGAAAAAPVTLTESTAPVTSTSTAATTAPTSATAAAATTIADGAYTGQAFTNRWGTVQVQVIYSGGTISDVKILSYPDGERKSVSINQRALPTLVSSTISAQSASVNSVSGATYTSTSYKQSLQSAIDSAQATA